jgi:hypothetical protein
MPISASANKVPDTQLFLKACLLFDKNTRKQNMPIIPIKKVVVNVEVVTCGTGIKATIRATPKLIARIRTSKISVLDK